MQQKIKWTVQFLQDYNVLMIGKDFKLEFYEMVNKSTDDFLQIDIVYPMVRYLGGVEIEIGNLVIEPISLDSVLSLLDAFVLIDKKGNFEVLQNFNILYQWATDNQVLLPDINFCQGYIYNKELVSFYQNKENNYELRFKYRYGQENTYILYRLSFFREKERYFVVKRKTF